jgi:hypothetical protein
MWMQILNDDEARKVADLARITLSSLIKVMDVSGM